MDPNLTCSIILNPALNVTLNASLYQPAQLGLIDWLKSNSYLIPSIGVIGALIFNSWQIIKSSKEKNIFVFSNLAETYESTRRERLAHWLILKKAVKSDEKICHEIGDKTSSLDYLLLRINGKGQDPLTAIEHQILAYEIQSINILNEICRYANKDKDATLLTQVRFSSEISYYQNRYNDLKYLWQHERSIRLFQIPRYDALVEFPISEFFENFEDIYPDKAKAHERKEDQTKKEE